MPLGNGGVLCFGKYVIFPVALKGEKFLIARPEAHGGDKVYDDFATLEASFGVGEMHPGKGNLKASVETYLDRLMDPVRKIFESPELKWQSGNLVVKGKGEVTVKTVKGAPIK